MPLFDSLALMILAVRRNSLICSLVRGGSSAAVTRGAANRQTATAAISFLPSMARIDIALPPKSGDRSTFSLKRCNNPKASRCSVDLAANSRTAPSYLGKLLESLFGGAGSFSQQRIGVIQTAIQFPFQGLHSERADSISPTGTQPWII